DGGAGETPARDEEKCGLYGDCGGDAVGEALEMRALHRVNRHGIAAGKARKERDEHEQWDEPGIVGKLTAKEEALERCCAEVEKCGEEQRCSRETPAEAMGELPQALAVAIGVVAGSAWEQQHRGRRAALQHQERGDLPREQFSSGSEAEKDRRQEHRRLSKRNGANCAAQQPPAITPDLRGGGKPLDAAGARFVQADLQLVKNQQGRAEAGKSEQQEDRKGRGFMGSLQSQKPAEEERQADSAGEHRADGPFEDAAHAARQPQQKDEGKRKAGAEKGARQRATEAEQGKERGGEKQRSGKHRAECEVHPDLRFKVIREAALIVGWPEDAHGLEK